MEGPFLDHGNLYRDSISGGSSVGLGLGLGKSDGPVMATFGYCCVSVTK